MPIKTTLLGAGAALLLSAGAALAVPAVAETDLNVRAGPGTQFPVIGSLANGESVDVGSCTGGWCHVSFSGGAGYANRRYLAMGGTMVPGPAVAASPFVYDDDYYDYGYAYGPSVGVGIYASPSYRYRHGWRGRHDGWQGQQGNWNRPGRPGGGGTVGPAPQPGFAGPPANWQRPGTGIGVQGGMTQSAPAGLRGGGGGSAPAGTRGGGGAAAPAGGGGAPSGGGTGFTNVPLAR